MVKRRGSMRGTVFRRLAALLFLVFLPAAVLIGGDAPRTSGAPGVFTQGDLDGDGRAEIYLRHDRAVVVSEGGKTRWRSPDEWRVEAFALGDVNNDGADELLLSLWKTGSFGRLRPFWHTGPDVSYRNHLFVLRFAGDTMRALWCSSNLDRPIMRLRVEDADDDGANELAVLEGDYLPVGGEVYTADFGAARRAVLRWDGWGFSLAAPGGGDG
ncbi:MAG: VCBS repeat-containing protein [Thermoanaerobacterales bacterium]|nr:VCBS repeat-containing protein [Thermoanaerobacterales bacterium]